MQPEWTEKIQEKLAEISISLVAIQKDLQYHILRTNQNEEYIDEVTKKLERTEKETQKQLIELQIAVESHRKSIRIATGVFALINIIIGIIGSIK